MSIEIDAVNYAILKIVNEGEKPLWKNKIHEIVTARADALPNMDGVSVQTIGRRVDQLRDEDYLSSCIVSPDDIKRDLIIAFKLTEKGETALTQKEDELLESAVQHHLFSADEPNLSRRALAELMQRRFEFDDTTKHTLADEYTWEELTSILALYYIQQHITDLFAPEDIDQLANLAGDSSDIAAIFTHDFTNTATSDQPAINQ